MATRAITGTDVKNAAHGEFEEFARGDVEDMISGVNRFLGDYLS